MSNKDKIIWLLTLILFCSFTIFETYSWGRYVLLGVSVLIALFSIIDNSSNYRYVIGSYHYHFLALIFFTFMSSAWGMAFNDPISKGITLTEIFFCIFFVYNYYYYKEDGVYRLLSVIKWSSYLIAVYSLLFYGVDYITKMVQSGVRIENEYANINTIGMLTAVGITIQIDQIFANKRFSLSALFCIPSFYMLIATQSRKAFVMLIVGVVLSAVFRNVDSRNGVKTVIRICLITVISVVLIRQILKLPIFSAVMNRMDKLMASLTGEGDAGRSAMLRKQMVEIGLKQFKKTPLLGIGIGCSHLIVKPVIGSDTYLHNNYIELLACGGLVGLIVYYSFYLDLFYNYLSHRGFAYDEAYTTCLILMMILVVTEYGFVALFSKSTYFFFMVFFLEKARMTEGRGRIPILR